MDRVPNLSIVVVNWNSGHRLSACLASIQACNQDGFRLDRVIVVDNASTDGSERGIEAANIPILFLSHPTNLGFAVACNRGAAEGRADYPLFLNPDTRLSPSSLTVPIRYL
jgi:GT2 family glycosyltransferase